MQVYVSSVPNLSKEEYRAFYRANYGNGGYMRQILVDNRNSHNAVPYWRHYDPNTLTISLWEDGDRIPENLIGWCLMTPVRTRRSLVSGTEYTKRVSKYTVQFWVKRKYRKKGYGKQLMNEVLKYDPRPHVIPHDEASGALFSNYKIVATRYDRQWLKTKRKAA